MKTNDPVVEGFFVESDEMIDLRTSCWSLARDQRAFGPNQLFVGFADAKCTLIGLAFTDLGDDSRTALARCLSFRCAGAEFVVAWCDETIPAATEVTSESTRFDDLRAVARRAGVGLVDWISCDSTQARSLRLACDPSMDAWHAAWGRAPEPVS